MKIILVTHFFPPSDAIATQRTLSFAKYWVALGHEVTILTTKKTELFSHSDKYRVIETKYLPNFLFNRVNAVKKNIFNKQSNIKGGFFKIIFRKLNGYGAFSSIRFPDITTLWPFYVDYKALSLSDNYDVVVSSHGPYTCHQIAHKIHRLGIAKKWIMDYRDLWTDNYMFKGLPIIKTYERYLEKIYLKNANSVVTVSESLACKLRALGAKKVTVVENGFEEDELNTLNLKVNNTSNKLIISYFGSLYPIHRDPELICKAINRLIERGSIQPEDISVNFYGSGKELVDQRAAENNLKNIIQFNGRVSRGEVLQLQNDADILFLIDSSKEDGVLTTKIFEYLTTRLPILAIGVSNQGEISKLLKKFDFSHVCQYESELIDLIEYYVNLKKNSGEKLRRKNLGIIANYSRSSLAKKFSLEFEL